MEPQPSVEQLAQVGQGQDLLGTLAELNALMTEFADILDIDELPAEPAQPAEVVPVQALAPAAEEQQNVPGLGDQQLNLGQQQPNVGHLLPELELQQPNLIQQQPNVGHLLPGLGQQQLPNLAQFVLGLELGLAMIQAQAQEHVWGPDDDLDCLDGLQRIATRNDSLGSLNSVYFTPPLSSMPSEANSVNSSMSHSHTSSSTLTTPPILQEIDAGEWLAKQHEHEAAVKLAGSGKECAGKVVHSLEVTRVLAGATSTVQVPVRCSDWVWQVVDSWWRVTGRMPVQLCCCSPPLTV